MNAALSKCALATCVLLAACERLSLEDSAHTEQAVAFGSEEGAPAAVVAVEYEAADGWDLCSGVLVAPDLVLTAAHCVTGQSGPIDCDSATLGEPIDPGTLRISFSPDLAAAPDPDSEFFGVEAIVLVAPSETSLCGQDVALLDLEQKIDAAIAEPLAVAAEVALPGEHLQLAGYGAGHPSGAGLRVRRISGPLHVICLGDYCNGTALSGWGGEPVSAPFVSAHEFIIEPSACSGDSGGPALRGDEVVGILSRGYADCTAPVVGLPRAAVARTVREHCESTGAETPEWAKVPDTGAGGMTGYGGVPGAGGDAAAPGGLGGTDSPPAPPAAGGCQLDPSAGPGSRTWIAGLLFLALAASRRRKRAWLGPGLPLVACLSLLGCTRQATDTEGRTFDLVCKNKKCRLEPAQDEGTMTSGDAITWEAAQSGRLLLACPSGERGDGRHCRPLTCESNAVCSKLGGERIACVEGLCQEAEHALTDEDRLALCLAGTGAWSDSPDQRSRFAMAQSCRPPCEVPAMCRQLH